MTEDRMAKGCDCPCNHVETKPPCVRCYGKEFIRGTDGKLTHRPQDRGPK